jgi:hypothetical protein
MNENKTLKEKFYEKVGLNWQWRGCKNPVTGYGVMKINTKMHRAHRVSYQIHNGEIPDGMCVLHSCDDPGCVNPEHLHLGTFGDNNTERAQRGRNRDQRGEKHNFARLTEEQVIEIKEKYKGGKYQKDIGKEYGVSQSHVSNIVRGIKWSHIPVNDLFDVG